MSHEGEYFVVHGANCTCNKAEDPTQEALLQVTTHKKIVFNLNMINNLLINSRLSF